MDLGLRDRACIVTGATSGIGRAAAELHRKRAAMLDEEDPTPTAVSPTSVKETQ